VKTVDINATPETDAGWLYTSIRVHRRRNCGWPHTYVECVRLDDDGKKWNSFNLVLSQKASAKLRKALEIGEAEIEGGEG